MSSAHSYDSDYRNLSGPQLRKLNRKMRKENKNSRVVDINPRKNQSHQVVIEGKNDKQREYINHIRTKEQIFAYGSAGTGKTYIAASLAAEFVKSGKVRKIVLTRPNVPAGPSLGFFPGNLNEKMEPWVAPFTDVLKAQLGLGAYDCMIKNGSIEIVPFETMRGRSFKDAFVICDEAQNVSPDMIKMLLTRIGEGSKLIVNGDTTQSDLAQKESGLALALRMIKQFNINAGVVEFTEDEIVRSGIVKEWVKAFNRLPSTK